MIEQLILCGDVPCFFSKSFDQMPRLSSFLQSLQQASIPIPDLEIVFSSLFLRHSSSNPSLLPAPISQPPKKSIQNSRGKKFSFFLLISFTIEMFSRVHRSQSSQIPPSQTLQTLHWRDYERIVVRLSLISEAKGAGIALGSSLPIADSRPIRPSEHNQAIQSSSLSAVQFSV